jgi:hypothetical protein
MGMIEPAYLGDAVYASFDGYHVELRVHDDRNPPAVFLDDVVCEALKQYMERAAIITSADNDPAGLRQIAIDALFAQGDNL